MKKVLTFGELLIRLQTSTSHFIHQEASANISAYAGGSEANVSVALGQMGVPSAYFSAVPANAITKEIEGVLTKNNVDTSKIKWTGDRIGMYILLSANGLTSGDVIYDRKYSSFSQLKAEDLDWDFLFDGCSWFHWTAITPALSADSAQLVNIALQEASKRGITISVDLNYRSKLWQYGKDPLEVIPQLAQYCDVIMGNIWAENKMLGTDVDAGFDRNTHQEVYVEASAKTAAQIFSLFPKCRHVSNTFRFMDNAKHNLFYGTYHTPEGNYVSRTFETNDVTDRIGSGDAFMAGLIYGIYNEQQPQQVIDTATQTGFDKLFVQGDFIKITK